MMPTKYDIESLCECANNRTPANKHVALRVRAAFRNHEAELTTLREQLAAAGDAKVKLALDLCKAVKRAEAAEASLSSAFVLFGDDDNLNIKRTILLRSSRRTAVEVMLAIRDRKQKGGSTAEFALAEKMKNDM